MPRDVLSVGFGDPIFQQTPLCTAPAEGRIVDRAGAAQNGPLSKHALMLWDILPVCLGDPILQQTPLCAAPAQGTEAVWRGHRAGASTADAVRTGSATGCCEMPGFVCLSNPIRKGSAQLTGQEQGPGIVVAAQQLLSWSGVGVILGTEQQTAVHAV